MTRSRRTEFIKGATLDILQKLKKTSISATDIAAQYWCERQMELKYIFGQKITKEIKKGKALHEELESETITVPIVLMPMGYADSLFKTLYMSNSALEALFRNGKGREIQIYGQLNGFRLVGKMDELGMKDGEVAVYEDKTKANDALPSEPQLLSHKSQVIVYRKMLEEIVKGNYTTEDFKKNYRTSNLKITDQFSRQLDELKVPKADQTVDRMADILFATYRKIPRVSDTLYIRYISQQTGKEIKLYKFSYNEGEMQSTLGFALKYWAGERESLPVPESERWKCNWCGFYGKQCKVWWPQKKL